MLLWFLGVCLCHAGLLSAYITRDLPTVNSKVLRPMGLPDIRIVSTSKVWDEKTLATTYTVQFEAPDEVTFDADEFPTNVVKENSGHVFAVSIDVPVNRKDSSPRIIARSATEHMTVVFQTSKETKNLQTDLYLTGCQYQIVQNITQTSLSHVEKYQAIVTDCERGAYEIHNYFRIVVNGLDSISDGTHPADIDKQYTDKYFNETDTTSRYDKNYKNVETATINLSTMDADNVELAEFEFNMLALTHRPDTLIGLIRLQWGENL
ncbi:uncharacterized protein LOC134723869 [Mytilus trossulus]|uniref:uncharacterized protein LOC134723869 n=1 Tax=Mytilus trossulus TaxID=6551 RepID=UPI003003BDCA